jgi:hypothetical protein
MIFNPCASLPLKQKKELRLFLKLNALLTVPLTGNSLITEMPQNSNLIYPAQ